MKERKLTSTHPGRCDRQCRFMRDLVYVTLKDADVSALTVRECVEFLQVLTAV